MVTMRSPRFGDYRRGAPNGALAGFIPLKTAKDVPLLRNPLYQTLLYQAAAPPIRWAAASCLSLRPAGYAQPLRNMAGSAAVRAGAQSNDLSSGQQGQRSRPGSAVGCAGARFLGEPSIAAQDARKGTQLGETTGRR